MSSCSLDRIHNTNSLHPRYSSDAINIFLPYPLCQDISVLLIVYMDEFCHRTNLVLCRLQTVTVSTEWPPSGQSGHPRQGQRPKCVAGTPRQSTELRPRHLADRRPDTVRGARVTALHPADGHSAQTVAVRTVTRNDPALWLHYLRDQSRAG